MEAPRLSEPFVRHTGRPYGFRPFHVVVGVVVGCLWVGLAAFALTHGHGESSAVDVYSELPPDFTAQLQARGVQYQGLSPVDATTTQKVLAQSGGNGVVASGSSAIVLQTSLTDTGAKSGTRYTDRAALMVVVPNAQTTGASSSSVFVGFFDPVTFQVLTTLTYDASAASASG
jgi:hypothetical protein